MADMANMTDSRPPLRHCRVLLPFTAPEARHAVMDYEHAWVLDDLATWFQGLTQPWREGLRWDWVPVTQATVAQTVADLAALGPAQEVVALNLCDGDDLNGYPGLSVVTALEAAGVAFTGAGADFYALSTSKLAMKERMATAGVPTSPWRCLDQLPQDLALALAEIGPPLFIKPDISAAAAGIGAKSRVENLENGLAWVERLRQGMHGFNFAQDRIFAEGFLAGREFSVLVAADATQANGVRSFAPCERVFPAALRPEQRFVTFERNYGGEEEDTLPQDSGFLYAYGPVEKALHPELQALGEAAFLALDGTGYARVDIRCDAAGHAQVLEVNANCGLTAEAATSTVGAILAYSGSHMGEMLALMLADAWRRRWIA